MPIFLWLISAPKDKIKILSRDVLMFLTKIDTPYPHMAAEVGTTVSKLYSYYGHCDL